MSALIGTVWTGCPGTIGTVWELCNPCECVRASFTAPDQTPIDGTSYIPEECEITGQNARILSNQGTIDGTRGVAYIESNIENQNVTVKTKLTTLVNSEGTIQFVLAARALGGGDISEGAGLLFLVDKQTVFWFDETGQTQIAGISADITDIEFSLNGTSLSYTLKSAGDVTQATGTETITTNGTGTVITMRVGADDTIAAIDDYEVCPFGT